MSKSKGGAAGQPPAAKRGMGASPRQLELLTLLARGQLRRLNLFCGSVRSGKTVGSLLLWALWAAETPRGAPLLMAGKTRETLRRNCLDLLGQLLGPAHFAVFEGRARARLFHHEVILSGAADARAESRLRGLTLLGAYCDEVSLVPEDFFAMLLSRLSAPGARLFGTTNPEHPGHWLKRRYIDRAGELDLLLEDFVLEDNPFLPEGYVENLKREYTGAFYERYILGRWVAAEGAVYPLFAGEPERFLGGFSPEAGFSRSEKLPSPHAATAERSEGQSGRAGTVCEVWGGGFSPEAGFSQFDISVGVDFGGSASAFAFVACGVAKDFSALYALASRRVAAKGVSPEDMYRHIRAFCDFVREHYGPVRALFADCAEPTLINGLRRRLTVPVRPSRKHPILQRVRAVNLLMSQGRFFYTRDCATLRDALQDAVFAPGRFDERLDNGSTDVDSLDAFEYSFERYINQLTRWSPAREPQKEEK